MPRSPRIARACLAGAALLVPALVRAQAALPAAPHVAVSGVLTVTNKGISMIPTFTLGRPAAMLEMSVKRERLSFDPQIRWGLDGKPWSFVFWGRYQVVRDRRFHLTVGAHPAIIFRRTSATIGGRTGEFLVARRYLAAEVSPSVTLSPRVNIGVYHLYSHALAFDAAQHTNFTALRATLSGIPLARGVHLRLDPQLYTLHIDTQHGVYANGTVTVTRDHVPLAVSLGGNTPLDLGVAGGTASLWNVSLAYTFP